MSNPVFNFHDVVLLITIAVCLVLALFQTMLPEKNSCASRLLAAFFLCIALGAACTLMLWNIYIALHSIIRMFLPYFFITALLLKGPVLYLYVLSLTREEFTLGRRDLLHLLPVIAIAFVLLIYSIDSEDLRFNTPDMRDGLSQIVSFIWYIIKIFPLFYGIVAVFSMSRYQKRLKNQFSSLAALAPGWLSILTFGFTLAWAWALAVNFLGNLLNIDLATNLGIAENYVTFVLVIALFLYNISYARHLIKTKEDSVADIEHKPSNVTLERIRQGVEIEKLYLKQNLNIEEFAQRIGVNYREVSHAINKHFGTNFFEFINAHRVDEAKRLLADKNSAHLTILDVLLESGFNSKSAFQRFFKRFVGVSPSEFRKEALGDIEKVA